MNMIYIDTSVLDDDTPVFGIMCSGTTEEEFNHEIEPFQHPVDAENDTIIDDVRRKPTTYNISFFISDSPQTLREQIEFLGNADFWKGLIQDEVRAFEETTLTSTGLKVGSQNSFSAYIHETLQALQGYELTVLTGSGELKNMLLINVNAKRTNQKRGLTFNLSFSKIFKANKEETETRIYKTKKSDSSLSSKVDTEKAKGKLQEEDIAALGSITGFYK